ncbi:hypothetical protein [Kitasatospora sp. NPDC097691]|uniref:hypothetical protein n=1 Tax=Kitasatospora sp. NPDC097691 TaxID=3157231 RepID=UPI0033244149
MLLTLVGEESADVRAVAGVVLATSEDRTPEVADAPAALVDEEDRITRREAGYGLAVRDDPRTAVALERLGPLTGPEYRHAHRADAVRSWWRRNPPAST